MKCTFIKGVSVNLRVEHADLEEYDDEDTIDGDEQTCTRYVQVTPNSTFKIRVTVESNFRYKLDDLLVTISLDGEKVVSYIAYADPQKNKVQYSYDDVKAFKNGTWQSQKFTFGSLDTTDETLKPDRAAKLKDLLSRLGEVSVSILRIKADRVSREMPRVARQASEIGTSVPEKALKGRSISNKATLGEAVPSAQKQTTCHVDYPYGMKPFATFTFKYRSRRDLQVEGVIERSPTPEPLEDRDPATLTVEEMREVVRRLQARTAADARVKKEIKRERSTTILNDDDDDDDDDGDGVEIIEQGPARKKSRTSGDSGIVILDLTGDD
ncbi:hypothetical protein TI39_contig429g00043 [Zymoseptoria brevis]|uniref:DUF7918 domain-containing protein n=1 Tax=Zymoseptoria brevis TaxID=1047168 RepID=A0A0F4GM50_9PEZI|nr:hypothetical protein TI39_contig429g00043 [Zymoseptoria brevis]